MDFIDTFMAAGKRCSLLKTLINKTGLEIFFRRFAGKASYFDITKPMVSKTWLVYFIRLPFHGVVISLAGIAIRAGIDHPIFILQFGKFQDDSFARNSLWNT